MKEAAILLGLLLWICAVTSILAYIWRRVSMTEYDYRWEIDFVMARKAMKRSAFWMFSTLGTIGTAFLLLGNYVL